MPLKIIEKSEGIRKNSQTSRTVKEQNTKSSAPMR
jgi:hypothetical protein